MSVNQNNNKTPMLDKFGVNLTKKAKDGEIEPVIGRENELKRIIQVLLRKKKNNVVITGEAGVGKTDLVKALALKIVSGDVPLLLADKQIISIELGALVAGTKFRGEFEERIQMMVNELEENPQFMLFIDEIHDIIGAGSSGGSVSAANIIKPSLSSGKLQLIGATTFEEFRKNIEKDAAFSRRFQRIPLSIPTIEETTEILMQNKSLYEKHHNVTFTEDNIKLIIQLADRYITDRNFPDKAIDVLDEVGSSVKMKNHSTPQAITDLEIELEAIFNQKIILRDEQRYEEAKEYFDKEKLIKASLDKAKKKWLKDSKSKMYPATEDDITEVVSLMGGVPVSKISVNENEKLKNLHQELSKRVIGQEMAIDAITRAVKKSRLGLKRKNSPIVHLYSGSTGLGKTLAAKTLATVLFGSDKNLIRINMNEYGTKESVTRLIGTSAGYVGYEDGGELTKALKLKPYSVVLLDEIEKAHPDVLNVFLQAFDEGELSDSSGVKVDCKNVIFIMTTNIGSKKVSDFGGGIGFSKSESDALEIESMLKKELVKTLKPELYNRIDNVIFFNKFTKENLKELVNLSLRELGTRVNEIGYKLEVDEKVTDFIIKKGYDDKYGARVLERTVATLIEDSLTDLILNGVALGTNIHVDVVDDAITYKV